jgi:hypothetical protein
VTVAALSSCSAAATPAADSAASITGAVVPHRMRPPLP